MTDQVSRPGFDDDLPVAPAKAANLLLWVVAGALVLLIAWAGLAQLDEVTRGVGRVIPSKQLQVVQNLEGGIVEEILVQQGQQVQAGAVLIRLDNTQFNAAFSQSREGFAALNAKIARLEAEAAGKPLHFDPQLEAAAPAVIAAEQQLYQARQNELEASLKVERSKLLQRRQSLDEARVSVVTAEQAAALAEEEYKLLEPLVAKGIEPQIELLRAKQRLGGAKGDAQVAKLTVERARQAVSEAEFGITALEERFRSQAFEELTEAKAERAGLMEELPALQDRVVRTEVKAPIAGVVNRVLVSTLGGVVKPGEPLVELVPRGDSLLVEAEVSPSDIAFLRAGQKARVKLTAYDYSTYGALDGRVEYISPDAIENADKKRVYMIHVRTDHNVLKSSEGDLPIIPGMVAEVDVLNGKRSILDYILKPLINVKNRALREK